MDRLRDVTNDAHQAFNVLQVFHGFPQNRRRVFGGGEYLQRNPAVVLQFTEFGESREIQMIPGLGVISVRIVQMHVTDQVDMLCDQSLIRTRLVGAIMKIEHAANAG